MSYISIFRTNPLFGNLFDPSDYHTLETALIVMLVLIYLITVAPFVGITREILDPETRRKSLEKKPYIRQVFQTFIQRVSFILLFQVCSPHLPEPASLPTHSLASAGS